MNAHQRRKAYRLGSRLLHARTPLAFTLPGACGVEFRGRVVEVDSVGRVRVLSRHVSSRGTVPVALHRLRPTRGPL